MTHDGQHLSKEELTAKGHDVTMESFMQGIGSDENSAYTPASMVSYLVFGARGLESRTEAIEWASKHLSQ